MNKGDVQGAVRSLFDELELPEQAFHDFQRHLQGTTASDDVGIPGYLQSQIKEVLNTTWFVSGSEAITEARRGSRPGDSMADLLFTIAFRHLLAKVQDSLQEYGVLTEIWWSGSKEPVPTTECMSCLEVLGPIWADDLAVLLTASDSTALLERVSHVAGVLFDFLLVHGMKPNLSPAKTELFVDLRGPGSVECRRQLHQDNYQLATASQHLPQPLRVIGSYKHLGTWLQTNGKLGKEIKCRIGAAHKTMTQYKGAIFANQAMKLSKKVQLFQTLVLSAVLYNSPIWMITRKLDVQKIHSGVMGLYRRVAAGHFGMITRHWTDEKVQAMLELPQPLDWLHVYRLRYAQHLVKAGDEVVWATLQQTTYWWELLDLSLEWLRPPYTQASTNRVVCDKLDTMGTVVTRQW